MTAPRPSARAILTAGMTEAEFQTEVIRIADRLGWLAFHHPDSRRATEAGLPDLILLHKGTGRVIFTELKSATGKIRPAQRVFLEAAVRADENEVAFWRPEDLDDIALILAGKKRCGPLVLPPPPRPRQKPTGADALARIVTSAQHTRTRGTRSH